MPYFQHGHSFLKLLRGAFSLAIWNKNASTLAWHETVFVIARCVTP